MKVNVRYTLVGVASLLATASAYGQAAQALAAAGTDSTAGSAAVSSQTVTSGATAAPNQDPTSSGQLAEIVVTAQRRAQGVLSVPAAITATSGPQLQAEGIDQITSLQFNTPGLESVNGVGYTQLYIRGIGNNIFVGADPSVATYVDDVPRIWGSLVNNLANVDRVEVLKGAQGGLYGRNATGGVVNIITRQPSDTPEADARVSYGTMNTLNASLYVNVPLNDKISWNVALQRESHNDYVTNLEGSDPLTAAMFPDGGGPLLSTIGVVTPAQTAAFFNSAINPASGYGNEDFWAADSKLRIRFTSNFEVTIDGDAASKHDNDGDQWVLTTPAYSQAYDEAILAAFGVVTDFPPGFYKSPTGAFETYNSTPAADWITDWGGSIKPKWSLPGVDIEDIMAYRQNQTVYDQNYAHEVTADVPIVKNSKWFLYEELRAVSTGAGPFHFLGGATYLRDHVLDNTTNLLFPPLYTVPAAAASTDTYTQSTDDVRDWSVYGQLGYDITHALNVTASGRYIRETNEAQFASPVSAVDSLVEKKFVPSATVSYALQGGGNVYARYAEGWKAGGVNPTVPPTFFPSDYGKIFAPEQVSTYEIGYKNSFLDHRMQITSDVFYNDIKDLQYDTNGNPEHPTLILAVVNAGSGETYGAEESVDWRPVRPLTVSANAAYLESRYTDFKNTNGSVLSAFNFTGRTMVNAPRWQLGFTSQLDQPLNGAWHLTGSWLTSYTSTVVSQYSTDPGIPNGTIPGYWLTNVRVGLKTANGRYQVSLYVDNLFDRSYFTFNALSALGDDELWGYPRIIGGDVQINFY